MITRATSDAVDVVVARIKATYGRWNRHTPVEQMRGEWDVLFNAHPQAAIEPVDANGVPCQWVIAPNASGEHVIAFFHGGGFQVGSLTSHRELMANISAASGAWVLGIDYRMTPEHHYPAPLEDGLTTMQWLREQGFSGPTVAMAGDSAGGGLALAVLLAMQRHGHATPAAAFVMSAWTDMTASGASYEARSAEDPIHQRSMMQALARNYLGKTHDPADPLASPFLANPTAMAALPPLLLQVGEREILVSDSEELARRVRAAGGQADCQIWPRMIHVFQQYPVEFPEASQALAMAGDFLAKHLDIPGIQRKKLK